jgi:hypothetical protein
MSSNIEAESEFQPVGSAPTFTATKIIKAAMDAKSLSSKGARDVYISKNRSTQVMPQKATEKVPLNVPAHLLRRRRRDNLSDFTGCRL